MPHDRWISGSQATYKNCKITGISDPDRSLKLNYRNALELSIMSLGFQRSAHETKIAIVVKRLTPSAKRGDIHAFTDGIREAQSRYGHDIADEGMRQCLEQFPDLSDKMIEFLPDEAKSHLHDAANSILAETIAEAGLRLEDHIRVTDHGIALTHQAVQAIAATGFPRVAEFGEGNESLEGIGINRDPFVHPLSECIDGSKYVNSWMVISLMITVAQGWDDDGERSVAQGHLEAMVSCIAPTLDLPTLQRRARYDDRALLQLASYVERGFNALAQQAKNH